MGYEKRESYLARFRKNRELAKQIEHKVPKFKRRKCKACGKVKNCAWMYTCNTRGIPVYRAHCVSCMKEWQNRERRKKWSGNPDRQKQRSQLRAEQKSRAIKMLGGKCKLCGYNKSLWGLDFHHKDPATKTTTIGRLLGSSWEKVEAEAKKCILLCKNCHAEVEEKEYNEKGFGSQRRQRPRAS